LKKGNKILLWILIIGTIIAIFLDASDKVERELSFSFLTSLYINVLNTFFAFFLFDKAKEKENEKFLKLVFGGMAIRILIILSVFVAMFLLLNISKIMFILFFFIIYFIFLFWEIVYYKQSLEKNK